MAYELRDRAAKKTARITIQQPTETRDAVGGVVRSWATFAERWAEVTPLRGREFWQAQQVADEVTTRFIIRHMDGLTPKMRISYAGGTYDILAAIDVRNEHREIEIMAKEVN